MAYLDQPATELTSRGDGTTGAEGYYLVFRYIHTRRNCPQDFSLKLFTKGTEHCFHGHISNFKLNLKFDFLLTY